MSDQNDDGGPAFPNVEQVMAKMNDGTLITKPITSGGMSLRDWFAGMALQGYNANGEICSRMTHEQAAKNSYHDADAMLAARKEAQ